MKIERIDAIPYKHSQVIVKVFTNEGIIGLGDAAPLTPFTGENQRSILGAIEGYLTPMMIDEDPFEIEKLSERMTSLPWNMAAKAALDMALFDIIGKALGVSICKLIGGCYNERLQQALAVGKGTQATPAEEVAKEAVEYVERGFKIIKIKVGRKYGLNQEQDFERVKAVVDAVKDDIRFWVDCQGGYTSKGVITVIKRIERFSPMYIEQPVPRKDIEGMAEVRRAVDTPIMADESVFSPLDAMKLIQRRAVDAIGIKFAKCGGIYNAKRIAALADTAGLQCVMISPGESSIGRAAYVHVAASSKNISICNFPIIDPEDWLTPLEVDESKNIVVPQGPGLGVELRKEIPRATPKGPVKNEYPLFPP